MSNPDPENKENSSKIWKRFIMIFVFFVGYLLGYQIEIDFLNPEPKVVYFNQDTNVSDIQYKQKNN